MTKRATKAERAKVRNDPFEAALAAAAAAAAAAPVTGTAQEKVQVPVQAVQTPVALGAKPGLQKVHLLATI
jgi:3-oxoacyl-ACP reductase-like protein